MLSQLRYSWVVYDLKNPQLRREVIYTLPAGAAQPLRSSRSLMAPPLQVHKLHSSTCYCCHCHQSNAVEAASGTGTALYGAMQPVV